MTPVVESPAAETDAGQRVTLRRASLADAGRLADLTRQDAGITELSAEQMSSRIEHGGALYYENETGPVSMLAWKESSSGWDLGPLSTPGGEAEHGQSRWLLTQVEALAIRLNVPVLALQLDGQNNAGYFERLGYEREAAGSDRFIKRVGGTWQLRNTERSA